jgi:hypothetical protein
MNGPAELFCVIVIQVTDETNLIPEDRSLATDSTPENQSVAANPDPDH